MANLQVKNVPESLHRKIRAYAKRRGRTVRDVPDQLTGKIKDKLANKGDKTVYVRADARAKFGSVVEGPVTSNKSVTIATEGTPAFSSTMPSSTLPDEQEPQSPMPATMRSQVARSSAMIAPSAGTLEFCFRHMRVSATPNSASASRSVLDIMIDFVCLIKSAPSVTIFLARFSCWEITAFSAKRRSSSLVR